MRLSFSIRLQMYLTSHPRAANRLLSFLGFRRIEAMGRRAALRTAQRAFKQVPFYRTLFEKHGFHAGRVQHLTWDDFLQLPPISKDDTEDMNDHDLLDQQVPSRAATR